MANKYHIFLSQLLFTSYICHIYISFYNIKNIFSKKTHQTFGWYQISSYLCIAFKENKLIKTNYV